MKTYENESAFVNNFAKDAKESIKSNGKFEAEWNNVGIVITAMDNNNSSKVTVYTGTINGVSFTGNITALKKRLNIAFTKEYNRTTASAKSAKTVITIKTDSELAETAKTANDRIMLAVATLRKYSDRYQLGMATNFVGIDSVESLIMQALKREREAAQKVLEEREAKEREAKEREAIRLKQLEAQRADLMSKLAVASAKQDFTAVMDITKQLQALK